MSCLQAKTLQPTAAPFSLLYPPLIHLVRTFGALTNGK
jgi:hypothetical protein